MIELADVPRIITLLIAVYYLYDWIHWRKVRVRDGFGYIAMPPAVFMVEVVTTYGITEVLDFINSPVLHSVIGITVINDIHIFLMIQAIFTIALVRRLYDARTVVRNC
jgi:hypothetical protein